MPQIIANDPKFSKYGAIDVPENFSELTKEEQQSIIKTEYQKKINQAKLEASQRELGLIDVATGVASNFGPSAVQFGKDITYPILNPITTAKSLLSLGKGVIELAIPGEQPDEETAKAVGAYLVNRYGGFENFKKTIAKDPVGFMSDMSAIFTAGGSILSKIPSKLAKNTGQQINEIGKKVDPLRLPGATARSAGDVLAAISGKATGTGTEALKTAFKAGYKGGDAARLFRLNIMGKASPEEAVNSARAGLDRMKRNRNLAFRRGIDVVTGDKEIDFAKIEKAVDRAKGDFFVTSKGIKQLRGGQALQNKINQVDELVNTWKNSPELHTAEGLDALKVSVDELFPAVTEKTAQQQKFITNVKNSIKDTIVAEVPEYGKVMADYSEASNAMREIEKALIGGNKSSADTALRKLQSVMRNNVNTNFGNRLERLKQLESVDDLFLQERLAGQALQPGTARGISGAVSLPAALTIGGTLDLGSAVGYGLATSPRLAGSLAFRAGTTLRPGTKAFESLPQSMKDLLTTIAETTPAAAAVSRQAAIASQQMPEEEDIDLLRRLSESRVFGIK